MPWTPPWTPSRGRCGCSATTTPPTPAAPKHSACWRTPKPPSTWSATPKPPAKPPLCTRRPFSLGPAVLYLHIARESLTDGDGVARIEGIGPVLLDQVRGWLRHRTVTIRPVLDIAGLPAVDSYEIPDRIADAARLRTPADCFPYSPNITRRGDIDHTNPYIPMPDGGPPGQTTVDNLARMPRRSHRIKTHSRWTVTQPRSGVWIWRTPHGHHYLVDHTGTTPLGKLGNS